MAKRIFDVSIHMNEMGNTKAGVPEENYLAIYPTSTHQLAITNSDGDVSELYNATNIPVCSDTVAGIAQVDGTTIISTEGVLSTDESVVINPMTAAGDMIVGGTSGAATKLSAGTDGYLLKMSSGSPAWAPNINYVDFLTTDWVVDGANFSLTIAASALPFGGSRDLLLQVSDASGNLVNINSAINESGDIILTSNSTFDGKLLVSGGASGEISTSGGGVWTKLYTSTPTTSDAASVEFVDIFSDDYTKYRVYFDIGCKLGSGQTTTELNALAGPAGATPSYYTSDYSGTLYWNSNMGSSSTGFFSATSRSYNFSGSTKFSFQTTSVDQAQGVFRGYMEIERNSGLWNAIIRWRRKTELLTYPAPNHGMCTWYIEQPVSALKFYDSNANNTIMAGAQITVYGIK